MRIPWRRSTDTEGGDRAAASEIETLSDLLLQRGVSPEDARPLAQRLAGQLKARPRSGREAFVDGVAASWHASSETRARLDKSASDIKEVERLMGAFTGELSKLDEVLEVLAAYVRRMRTSKRETSEGQTLH